MAITIDKVQFPALLFGLNNETVEFLKDKDTLSIANELGLKKGVVIGKTIVDSSGKTFKTTSARK